jgi:hypothetical protein
MPFTSAKITRRWAPKQFLTAAGKRFLTRLLEKLHAQDEPHAAH